MASNITAKRKLSREQKKAIRPILGKLTKTEIASRAGLSRSPVIEAFNQGYASDATYEKLHKIAQELENTNNI